MTTRAFQKRRNLGYSLIFSLAALTSFGCTVNQNPIVPTPPAPTTAALEDEVDFEAFFQGFDGAFVLYDPAQELSLRYHPEQCSQRLLPASTFKIMNSLIGLEIGVIPDENYVMRWDGTEYAIPTWNQDHTLTTAFQNSVVWYYQEVARRVGRESMQSYIAQVGYGNQDITGPIDYFWLDGSLKISAEEQVQLLKRLYEGDLPFSKRSIETTKEIMALEKTDTYQLSGKTGSGQTGDLYIGWFVGFLEEDHSVVFFAANIKGTNSDAKGLKAKEITLEILQALELLP
jgi:beta-lactamase class D